MAGDEPVHAHGAQQAPRIGNVGRERNDDADPVNQVRDYMNRGPERADDGNGDREPRAIDVRIERVTLDNRVVAVLRRPHDLPDEGRRLHNMIEAVLYFLLGEDSPDLGPFEIVRKSDLHARAGRGVTIPRLFQFRELLRGRFPRHLA